MSSKCDLTSGMFVVPVVDQLENDWPKISIRSLLQFAPVCHSFRDVSLFIETAEDLKCLPGSALGNVCFLGTCPPKNPTCCSSKEESLRGHNEKVAAAKATCLNLSVFRGCLLNHRRRLIGFCQMIAELLAFPHPGLHAVCVFICTQPIARLSEI